MPRTLIFDLDGTLVDSVPDLLASCNRVMATLGLAPFTAEDVTPMVGDGAKILVRRLMAARGVEARAEHGQAVLADYMAHVADHTRPYPGIPDALETLAQNGWRLVVCTNKPEAPARAVLQKLHLLHYFHTIVGGDTTPHQKPDPRPLLAAVEAAHTIPQQALMLGDHANDLAAAQAAHVRSIFAPWGYGQNTGATTITPNPYEIPNVAERLLPAA